MSSRGWVGLDFITENLNFGFFLAMTQTDIFGILNALWRPISVYFHALGDPETAFSA